jgi:AraC-like DNA-binding protein
MRYREFEPDARLRPAIKCYWFLTGTLSFAPNGSEGPGEFERILPDGCSELIFHCGDRFTQQLPTGNVEQPRTLLIGPNTRALVIRPGCQVDVIGVRFHPGGVMLLGGAPAPELRDCALDALDVGIQLHPELLASLAELRSDVERVSLLDRVLLKRLERVSLDHSMLGLQRWIADSGGTIPTQTLARAAGLSMRQLQRRFQAATGVQPKLLSRLVRLQRALSGAQQTGATLASVAAAAGYADQAHFTRDFREFAGVSPSEYFRGERRLSDFFIQDSM